MNFNEWILMWGILAVIISILLANFIDVLGAGKPGLTSAGYFLLTAISITASAIFVYFLTLIGD